MTTHVKYSVIAAVVSALILLPAVIYVLNSTSVGPTSNNHATSVTKEASGLKASDEAFLITQFQSQHSFKKISSAGSQNDDPSDFVLGTQSLKLATDGDGLPAFTRKTGISPSLNLVEKSFKIWIKVSDINNVQELRITVTGDRFQTFRNYWIFTADGTIRTPLKDNEWTLVTIESVNIRDFGSPDLSKIDTIQLRVVDKGQGPVSVWFNGLSSK